MDEPNATGLLNVSELAAYLRVPRSWVYERSRRDAIPIMMRVGKYLRFHAADAALWVRAGCPERWPGDSVRRPGEKRSK